MAWYLCWNCGLRFGEDDGLELPSRLCGECSKHRRLDGADRYGGKHMPVEDDDE